MEKAAPHTPVMREAAIAALDPRAGDIVVDATVGAGGYSRALLATPLGRLYGFDRDPAAAGVATAIIKEHGDRFVFINRPFADIEVALGEHQVRAIDGAVFDFGVSSMQLDQAERGFSFAKEGPLSMKMDGRRPDVRDALNEASEDDLTAIFRAYGDEPHAKRIARAIVRENSRTPIETTTRLADIVAAAAPARPGARTHPATRAFQALRIFVNDELGQIEAALKAVERLLRVGGRLVVVSFHSIEDRLVKRFLAERSGRAGAGSRHRPALEQAEPSFDLGARNGDKPDEDEVRANPRARSARLRVGLRTAASAIDSDTELFTRPALSRRLAALEF